jgi:hypothetical protein
MSRDFNATECNVEYDLYGILAIFGTKFYMVRDKSEEMN